MDAFIRRAAVATVVACSLLAGSCAWAADRDSASVPFIGGVDEYIAVPGSTRHAKPGRVYRAVFDARRGPAKPDDIIPTLNMIGSELNTLAAHGVPRRHAKFVVVFHTSASNEAVLEDAAYRARHGVPNPNLNVIRQLRAAGVGLFVCGQSLLADKVPLSAVTPEVTIVEDGIITIMEHANDGFAQFVF